MSVQQPQLHVETPQTWERNTLVGVGVFVLFSLLGLAYNAGMMAQRLDGMQAAQTKLQADDEAAKRERQADQLSTASQLSRIEQTLSDMQQSQAAMAEALRKQQERGR